MQSIVAHTEMPTSRRFVRRCPLCGAYNAYHAADIKATWYRGKESQYVACKNLTCGQIIDHEPKIYNGGR